MTEPKKPWEETWLATDNLSVLGDAGAVLDAAVGISDPDDYEKQRARAQLAAAATDLYRALKSVEWGAGGGCPECGGLDPEDAVRMLHNWPDLFPRLAVMHCTGHRDNCQLAAALRKAEGR